MGKISNHFVVLLFLSFSPNIFTCAQDSTVTERKLIRILQRKVVGSISTKVMMSVKLISLLFQLFSSSFIHGLDETHKSQLEMNWSE